MREILFRGKRTDNGKWAEGCLVIDESRTDLFRYRIQPTESGNLFAPPVDPETVCQYTGICDSNNNKVFENDIIEGCGFCGRIRYGCYHDYVVFPKAKHIGAYIEWPEEYQIRKDLGYWVGIGSEVIGNAFDNPELIQEVER